MSECNRLWEAICRVQDETDRASVGGTFPRKPMPIGMLFAELDRSMARREPPTAPPRWLLRPRCSGALIMTDTDGKAWTKWI